ncbi:ankyrin [Coniochaeta sp. PMI_546]|nr:ankyrin [Coniochaeta sp. PMI_546]
MDPISAIVSIIELCSQIGDYISRAVGATEAINQYRLRLEFCKSLLTKLQLSPENTGRRKDWETTLEILNKPGAPLHSLEGSLALVQGKLGPSSSGQSGLRKTLQKLMWPFDEKQVGQLINAIDSDIKLIEAALSLNQHRLLMDLERSQQERDSTLAKMIEALYHDSEEVRERLEELQNVQTAEDRDAVLEWLSRADYGGKQSDSYHLRQPGTGSWLLDSPEFTKWKENRGETLFCPGMPGAGKTVLTSVVVRNLMDDYADSPNVAIAWLYCDFRLKSEQKLNNMLASLVKQLLLDQKSLPSIVERLYRRNRPRKTHPSTQDLVEALESAVARSARVFVLVDGLDEYSDGRDKLLGTLLRLQATYQVNLFATSRYIPDIVGHFEDMPRLEIRATDQDIKTYLEGYLEAHIGEISSLIRKDHALQRDIVDAITEAADGMFLLAHLYIGSIKDKMQPVKVREAIQDFKPRSARLAESKSRIRNDHKNGPLSEAYEKAMSSIMDQAPEHILVAKQALSWITFAKRPLLMDSMGRTALSYAAYRANETIFKLMIDAYLGDDNRTLDLEAKDNEGRTVLSLAAEKGNETVVRLLLEEYQVDADSTDKHGRTPLSYAADIGHHHMVKLLLASGQVRVDPKDDQGMTPLCYAVANRSRGTPELTANALIETGQVDLNVKTRDRRTLLSYAAQHGYRSTVQLLLASGQVDINCKDSYGQTPLFHAMSRENESSLQHLTATNRQGDDAEDNPGNLAPVMQILLATDNVYVNVNDDSGYSPLMWAVKQNMHHNISLLLEDGRVDVNLKSPRDGDTPLIVAVGRNDILALELLLKCRDIDLDLQNRKGVTALSLAIDRGYHEAIRLLREKYVEMGKVAPEAESGVAGAQAAQGLANKLMAGCEGRASPATTEA